MTNEERQIAFQMRLEGCSWEQIAERLHYADGHTVWADMRRLVFGEVKKPNTIYPNLQKLISEKFGGSIRSFCVFCDIPRTTMRELLEGKRAPNSDQISAIAFATGLKPEVAFAREDGAE